MAHKLPKAPKKPKVSASYTSWENYDRRVRDWQAKCARIVAEKTKKASLIRKHQGSPKVRHMRRVA